MLYVTVATLKSHLRIDGSDEDSLLSQYILAAQEEAEQRMHRAIYSETDENAVTNDLTKIPPGITQFILVAAGDLYKNRENRQEKSFTTYFQNLLIPGFAMISNIPAGKLTARVTLLRPVRTISTGTHATTYTDDVTVWANIKQVSLREIMRSQVEMQTETYTVLMRYRPGITQEWCLRLPNQKRYRIISINTDPESGAMILGAELDNSISQTVTS